MSVSYPQPGTILAERYRVEGVIGHGGMGIVLKAQNVVTERFVAIKWIHAELAENPDAVTRLFREAKAACRVRHTNVVDVYDVLHDRDSVFLVMELLEGESLEALLERGQVPPHELIRLLLPAMEGVAEAHRLDIVHRDIHPGNIFLARKRGETRPVTKVLDFGISKIGDDRRKLTRSNISMGTPLYMSYEQLYSARDVDARTDVYSFGVILYQGLTGTRPFDGDSFMEVAGKITAATPAHPKELRPELPSPLAELVMWAIKRDREERIVSIESLVRELEPFAHERAFNLTTTELSIMDGNEASLSDASVRPAIPSQPSVATRPPSRPARSVSQAPEPLGAPEGHVDTLGNVSSPLARSACSLPSPPYPARSRTPAFAIAFGMLVAMGGGAAITWFTVGRAPAPSAAHESAPPVSIPPPVVEPAPQASLGSVEDLAPAAGPAAPTNEKSPTAQPPVRKQPAPTPQSAPARPAVPAHVADRKVPPQPPATNRAGPLGEAINL